MSAGMAALLALPYFVLAANNPPLNALDEVAATNGPYAQATDTSLTQIIGTVVGIALGLLGVIFLVLMIFAGYNWMTAQGEEEKVTKAKSTIIRAIVGIIIVVGSYAIWMFVLKGLFK